MDREKVMQDLNMLLDRTQAGADEMRKAHEQHVQTAKQTLAAEKAAHEETKKKLQAARSEADEWKKKCELMADHPEVKAATLARAEANAKAAQEALDRARKNLNLKPVE